MSNTSEIQLLEKKYKNTMGEIKDLNWLKTKQDETKKNFGMVGMGYVVMMHNYYQEEITVLRTELKAEREVVDFYANDSSWDNADELADYICIIDADHGEVGVLYDNGEVFHDTHGGKLAREAQSKRKVTL